MTQTITWHSLSNPIKAIMCLILIQNTATCLSIVHASSKLDESDGIIFVGEMPEVDSDLNLNVEVQSKEIVDLNCFPRNLVWKKVKNSGPEPDRFDCGSNQYEITSYDQTLAGSHLGGYFNESKMLIDQNCKIDNDRIVCREEEVITQGRASGLVAFRSFSATFSKKESE